MSGDTPIQRRAHPNVTVVTPVFNESEVVELLLKELGDVVRALPEGRHEIVVVDDGSSDDTASRIRAQLPDYPEVRLLRLSRNFGHQAAVSAGIDHARGDAVFVIDGDLQDNPRVLPDFIEEYRNGADVVYAKRVARKESLWLRAAYSLHYRLLAWMSAVELPVDAGDFGLMSRRVVDAIRSMPERQRYVRGLRAWVGFEQVGIEVERRPRMAGQSKYGLTGLLRLASDGILAFSVVPLRLSAVLGAIGLVGGALYGAFALVVRLVTGTTPQGFTTLVLLQVGFGGLILLMLGIVGEYVGRVYEEVKARPVYIVAEELSASDG